jgi:dTDP-4-dehydrorhamnose 3,5-epimerase
MGWPQMILSPSAIPEVVRIQPRVFEDARGFFIVTFRADQEALAGITGDFVQDNHSGSRKNILRGLHYQIRQPQGKLVRVVSGKVFDVAVDLRRSSPTFGCWVSEIISADNKIMLWIPSGFAHGFYVLSEWADVLYKTTAYYSPEWERTLLWNDPMVGIRWPILPDQEPILSSKDASGAQLENAEVYD